LSSNTLSHYQIFHRVHSFTRSIFCIESLFYITPVIFNSNELLNHIQVPPPYHQSNTKSNDYIKLNMMFSTSTLVLATLAIESVSAISLGHAHRHLHAKKSDLNAVIDAQVKRDAWVPPAGYVPADMSWTTNSKLMAFTKTMGANAGATPGVFVGSPAEVAPAPVVPTTAAAPVVAAKPTPKPSPPSKPSTGNSLLADVSDVMSDVSALISKAALTINGGTCLTGKNPTVKGSTPIWIGKDGAYVSEMVNGADEDITLVLWQDLAEQPGKALFVQTSQPLITIQIPQGKSIFVSMASDGGSGGFTALYSDASFASDGFIHNTIGEFTIAGANTVFDVSYETGGSNGKDMSIQTPNCVSHKTSCSFSCLDSSAPSCSIAGSYALSNGDNCVVGTSFGQPSGGCGGYSSTGSKTTVTFL